MDNILNILVHILYTFSAMFIIAYILLEFDIFAFRNNSFFQNILKKYRALTFQTQLILLSLLSIALIVSFFFLDILVYGTETILEPPDRSSTWRYEGFPTEPGYWAMLCFPILLFRKITLRKKSFVMPQIYKKKSIATDLKETMIMLLGFSFAVLYAVAVYMFYHKIISFF